MKTLKAFVTLGLLVFSASSLANPVQVRIHGLQQDTGSIIINLFASAASWDSEVPDKIVQVAPLKGTDAIVAMDLPPGTYAFFLYHDVDGNGELKRGLFGMPGEPYAFSNNVHIGFSKPSFQKMQFAVGPQGALQEIQLVNP